MKIIFASNNENKRAEIQQALGDAFQLVSLREMNFYEEIPETTPTLEGNALQKANYVFDRFKLPVFADDSGLEIEALNGEPGVDTAHYSGTRDAVANNVKVLRLLENVDLRNAKFRTVIAFVTSAGEWTFEGEVKGTITTEMRGENGFGYDPVFIPEGENRTFGEMSLEEKGKMSHRIRALKKFVDFLKKS